MLGLGDEERFIMDIVPALAVILFKRRVLSRSSVDSVLSLYSLILNSSFIFWRLRLLRQCNGFYFDLYWALPEYWRRFTIRSSALWRTKIIIGWTPFLVSNISCFWRLPQCWIDGKRKKWKTQSSISLQKVKIKHKLYPNAGIRE